MTGYSLHIGLNTVDQNAYQPPPIQLSGCINDANSMQQLASSLGYRTKQLIDAQATSVNVLESIGNLSRICRSGDIAFVTYSGHGGQDTDYNSDEPDGLDETWACYDRQVCDDELYSLYGQFPAGVRIVVVSDSCHSGSVARSVINLATREALVRNPLGKDMWPQNVRVTHSRPKYLPTTTCIKDDQAKRSIYRTVQALAGPARNVDISAQLILLAGCQDNQFSQDGDVNGAFTEALLRVWSNGGFAGDYQTFLRRIVALMPPDQTPNFFTVGSPDAAFLGQKPFSVSVPSPSSNGSSGGSVGGSTWPTIRQGARGPAVTHLQERLNVYGYTCTVDGSFGPATAALVRSFQRDQGLTPDGVVGPATWGYLDSDPILVSDQEGSSSNESSDIWGDTGASTSGGNTSGDETSGDWGNNTGGSTETTGTAVSRPTLRRGDTGEDVRYLQEKLSDLGYWLTPDGVFGAGTESTVRSFQNSQSLTADGIVGPATWAALEG